MYERQSLLIFIAFFFNSRSRLSWP